MYNIMGTYNGKTEIIDVAKDEREAIYLVGKYIMAYGPEWDIWKE